jgi:hypothetical protein
MYKVLLNATSSMPASTLITIIILVKEVGSNQHWTCATARHVQC